MNFYKITYTLYGKHSVKVLHSQTKYEAIQQFHTRHPEAILLSVHSTSTPLTLSIKKIVESLHSTLQREIPLRYKVATLREIAVMSDAGLALDETIEEVAQGTKEKKLQKIYTDIHHRIHTGQNLYEAFKPYQNVFGNITLGMVKLADRSGNVAKAFHTLADMLELLDTNRRHFKKAIRIPLITLLTMILAFVVIMHLVIPKFKEVFTKFGAELPLMTQLLFKTQTFFATYGLLLLAVMVGGYFFIKILYRNHASIRLKVDTLLTSPKLYIIQPLLMNATMHKYNVVFTALVSAGVPIVEALKTSVSIVENSALKQRFLEVENRLQKGISLSDALQESALYESMLVRMLYAGEKSGTLIPMLEKVTHYYHQSFQDKMENLTTYIEPIMMFFMALLLLVLAVGIFMPMWDLSQVVKR
jgi:general secretion pathway protein F